MTNGRYSDSKDSGSEPVNGFQIKIGKGACKEDGSVLGLTSAGPQGVAEMIPERPSCK